LDFEREHERVGRELDRWLRTDLPAAREELADPSGACLGSGAGDVEACHSSRLVTDEGRSGTRLSEFASTGSRDAVL
jgi:hypothetical protein